jgi:hypothetical protein
MYFQHSAEFRQLNLFLKEVLSYGIQQNAESTDIWDVFLKEVLGYCIQQNAESTDIWWCF